MNFHFHFDKIQHLSRQIIEIDQKAKISNLSSDILFFFSTHEYIIIFCVPSSEF